MVLLVLGLIGLTLIVSKGYLFEPLQNRSRFFACPMCLGAWVGMLGELLREHLDGEKLAPLVIVLVGGTVSFLSWFAAVTVHRIETKP